MTARYGKEFVVVGTVVKPHGIRGEFCIKSFADSPFLFDEVHKVFLASGRGRPKPLTVKTWRMHKSMVLMTAAEVSDRNRAEEIRGMDILVRKEDLPEIEEGDFYLHELEGLLVCMEDGTEVGCLSGFIETPSHDVWVIAKDDGNEVLLPGVPEFILGIDPEEEVITIAPPEGLLELYAEVEEAKSTSCKKVVQKRPAAQGQKRTRHKQAPRS